MSIDLWFLGTFIGFCARTLIRFRNTVFHLFPQLSNLEQDTWNFLLPCGKNALFRLEKTRFGRAFFSSPVRQDTVKTIAGQSHFWRPWQAYTGSNTRAYTYISLRIIQFKSLGRTAPASCGGSHLQRVIYPPPATGTTGIKHPPAGISTMSGALDCRWTLLVCVVALSCGE